jgi:hypothetical protein
MAERDLVLEALVKDVLGPRQGPNEILSANKDPLNEYITGVLSPEVSAMVPEIEQSDEIEAPAVEGEEDNPDFSAPVPSAAPGTVSPSLDPRARPRAIGLSILLDAGDAIPSIEICATWARYRSDAVGNWNRQPESYHIPPFQIQDGLEWKSGTGVRITLRTRRVSPRRHRVSIHLINIIRAVGNRPTTEEHVFQPQLRIVLAHGTTLIPLDEEPKPTAPADERSMWLLYSDRPAMARGHMCGATWKAIDPEIGHPANPSFNAPPFKWVDSAIVPRALAKRFGTADVRTEFVPTYPVVAPDMDWEAEGRPELDPEVLSECLDKTLLRVALEPIHEYYETWINDRAADAAVLAPDLKAVADLNLAGCRRALERIERGIEVICNNLDVRMAFCFANKAIALQARWQSRGKKKQHWRPFQLAFILMNVAGVADPMNADRTLCDLLWIPTGGGKTEAYLGLAAFALALRRFRAPQDGDGHATGEGVCVLSRYTLRLLTIQQFRRALRLVTACEYLRVMPVNGIGWRPASCPNRHDYLWGGAKFSIGLWVGGGVTPNSLESFTAQDQEGNLWWFPGAIDLLKDTPKPPGQRTSQKKAEPAQILECPAGCRAVLAIPHSGLANGDHTLHFVFKTPTPPTVNPAALSTSMFVVSVAQVVAHPAATFFTLTLRFTTSGASTEEVDAWWKQTIAPALGSQADPAELQAARPSRPGYFIRSYRGQKGAPRGFDFDLVCPNPECELNQVEWAEKVPVPFDAATAPAAERSWQQVLAPFQVPNTGRRKATRIPVPAFTVDDQVYRHCPSMVIATVDKFARLAFESEAATLFGHVEHYHARSGFYREECPPGEPGAQQGHPTRPGLAKAVQPLAPPQLIIQDELHLVEGPLGSMVGIYETAVEKLCERVGPNGVARPKYIASTATVRSADDQVKSLFDRTVAYFPPPCLSAQDNFFTRTKKEAHALDSRRPGRLYVGVCAPGWGALTPIVRVWSALLQAVWERLQAGAPVDEIDPYWTLVGYFNAIRELAGAVALYRQDINQRIPEIVQAAGPRPLPQEDPPELASRKADPMQLPALLDLLDVALPGQAADAVVATSMFGTGVDVPRLGLMVVHGQPKTTSSYIQATGRVGRQDGGLVITMLRPARVRDLAHYEFFTAYHRQLYRFVEPVTVSPFSPRARDRSLGPLAVALLRQAPAIQGAPVHKDWRPQYRLPSGGWRCEAGRMGAHRLDAEVQPIAAIFEGRAMSQPAARRPPNNDTLQEMNSWLDRWMQLARGLGGTQLFYNESTMLHAARECVVLGDPAHEQQVPVVVFENAPNSLREVEATTTFRTK